MKKLIPLILIILLLPLASAREGWRGNGVSVEGNGTLLKATSTGKGVNTLISPPTPINTTLKYSFSIKGENTSEVLAEIAYFNENGTFIFARNVTFIGRGSFDWKKVEITAVPFKKARFSSLLIAINSTGVIYLRNFTVGVIKPKENTATKTETKTETPRETEAKTTETGKEVNKNLQKLLIDDEGIRVEILLNKTYRPGDKIRADFYITNKKGTINEIDVKLEVYYLGIKVFSYGHPSWREYAEGKKIHIFQESGLPLITPPGKYTLKFYITPVGGETRGVSTSITVEPNLKWFLFLITLIALFVGVIFLIKKYWRGIIKRYQDFSIGQKFVFFAVIGLIAAAVILGLGAENYANDVAIMVYYLLVIGVLNEWIEYLEPRWDREDARAVFSVYLLALLTYLSRDIFTIYTAIALFVVGTAIAVLNLKPKRKRRRTGSGEIEITGETEEGFITYEERGREDAGEK